MSTRAAPSSGRRRRIDGPNANNRSNPLAAADGLNGNIGRSNGYPPTNPKGNNTLQMANNDPSSVTAHSSLLQPRLALYLGLPRRWHPFLFVCRLVSVGPAVWWGIPSVVRFLALFHLKYIVGAAGSAGGGGGTRGGGEGGEGGGGSTVGNGQNSPIAAAAASALPGSFVVATYDWSSCEAKMRFTEAFITVLWCFASGWVSYFLTDGLMSRALLNYTPLAAIFRLVVINLLNFLVTSSIMGQFSAPTDPRFAFAPWIVIASLLTLIYYLTQRGIKIRNEYAMSISIFSTASYVSMLALLWHLYIARATEYPDIPLVRNIRMAYQRAEELSLKLTEYNVGGGF